MKLLYAQPVTAGSLTFFIPSRQWGTFLIKYRGTAQAGQTVGRPDLGNIILNWNGNDIINADAEMLQLIGNTYGGVSEFVSNAGGSYSISVFIPCGTFWDSKNVYDISPNDKVYFKCDFGALIPKVASGFVEIYGKEKLGVHRYFNNIIERPIVASGASDLTDIYNVPNIANIVIKNPSIIDRIQITKDGETVVDAETSTVQAYSDWIHLLETTNNVIVIELAESQDIEEALGSTIQYRYQFNGAGTLEQYFMFIEFANQKARESTVKRTNTILRKQGTKPPTTNSIEQKREFTAV